MMGISMPAAWRTTPQAAGWNCQWPDRDPRCNEAESLDWRPLRNARTVLWPAIQAEARQAHSLDERGGYGRHQRDEYGTPRFSPTRGYPAISQSRGAEFPIP